MEKYRFGLGEYKYFKYPLPEIIQILRQAIYPKLSPIANTWMKMLNMKTEFPDRFDDLKTLCHENNQRQPTVLILKYGKGGHNTLHQDLYGDIFFSFQVVFFLNEPDDDYTGGEFVITQQTPVSGKTMKKENRLFFLSEQEVLLRGYIPCGHHE